MFLDRHCGAWQVDGDSDSGRVEFRVFIPSGPDPHISGITAIGNFQSSTGGVNWEKESGLPLLRSDEALGAYWVARTSKPLPAGFYEYKYLVEFEGAAPRTVTDPCARYGGLQDQNSGIAVGGTTQDDNVVRPLPGGRLPLADLNIYELMIDDFTAEYRGAAAPLDAVVERLDHLADIGTNAILFMPWTAWVNPSFDWGYEPFQYFALEARYANEPGEPEEKLSRLKNLISCCHDRGIHVIMDGVFNHVSRQFPYQQFYREPAECPFTAEPFGHTFPGLQDLDFYSDCTNVLIAEVCAYWIDEFGIDGIRFDNTVNYFVAGDIHGLPELLTSIRGHLDARGEENFSLTLEHMDLSAADVTNETAATSFWDDSLRQLCFEALWDGVVDGRLLHSLNNRRYLASDKIPTLYLSNHDHSHVAWRAGARDEWSPGAVSGWWRLQPFLIALYTSTGVPMCHNGQEFGEEHVLPEDDHGTGRRVTGRPIRWRLLDDPIGGTLRDLHRRLATLRRDHSAMRSSDMVPADWDASMLELSADGVGWDHARQIAIYRRLATLDDGRLERLLIVLNFSDEDRVASTAFPSDGAWVDLLSGFDGSGTNWAADVVNGRADIPVGSHWGRILWQLG